MKNIHDEITGEKKKGTIRDLINNQNLKKNSNRLISQAISTDVTSKNLV